MRKYQNCTIFFIAFIAGIFLSVSYVNPYEGDIFLSELVLQLSGSRAEFVLNYSSAMELVDLAMRLMPSVIMETFLGIALYRHFCTASVYVFSRCTDRIKWYWREMLFVGMDVFIFQGVVMAAVIITAALRYQIEVDVPGIYLLVCHFVIYTLWSYSMVVLMNLVALGFGSSLSFTAVMAIQSILIVLLVLAIINIVILIIGASIVKRHDLLISDSEIGVG